MTLLSLTSVEDGGTAMHRRIAVITILLLSAATLTTHGAEDFGAYDRAGILAEDLAYQIGWIHGEVTGAAGLRFSDGADSGGEIVDIQREIIVDDIAHYRAAVRIGDGPYDVINIHRVVREIVPYWPIRTADNVFLLHGDGVGFVKFIFGSAAPSLPDDQSVAVYLASNDVDVWGMDQDWVLVPGDTTDFAFMADWGMQRQVDNLELAIGIASHTRRLAGGKGRRMNLLGYSSGGLTAYALANQESQLPPGRRLVGGLIPVDIHFKYDPGDEAGIQFVCDYAETSESQLDAGIYADESGLLFQTLGYLARTAPDDPSPILPGLTNLQASLFLVSATYLVFPFTPTWHYMGGVFEDGLPVDLEYTSVEAMLDFLDTFSPFEPLRFVFEYVTVLCDEVDLPFDDHLADITVPVLYLAGAGGIGETGVYTTSLLGSRDITLVIGQLRSDEERALDIGHIDIWTAESADDIFWEPLVDWLKARTPGP